MISSSKVTALILYACFLAMLIFVPKIASVVEFIGKKWNNYLKNYKETSSEFFTYKIKKIY